MIRRFTRYWLSLHRGPLLPARTDLDPLDFHELLPNIRLLDILGDPPRFRVRLTGENIRRHFNAGHIGQCFDEFIPDFAARKSFADLTIAIAEKRPAYHKGICDLNPVKDYVPLERVIVPFAQDGTTPDSLGVLSLYG